MVTLDKTKRDKAIDILRAESDSKLVTHLITEDIALLKASWLRLL
jgi:hypothetical protein